MPHTRSRRQVNRVTFEPLDISFPKPISLTPRPASNIQSLLDLIRRAEIERAAKAAEATIKPPPLSQQGKQDAALALISQPAPSPKKGVLEELLGPGLGNLLPGPLKSFAPVSGVSPIERFSQLDDALIAVQAALPKPVQEGVFGTALAPLGFIPGVIPSEEVRSRAQTQIKEGFSGQQGFLDTARGLREIQEERPLSEQIGSSLFASPLGNILNLVGPGAVVAKAKPILQTAAPAVRSAVKLDELPQVIGRLSADQGFLAKNEQKGPLGTALDATINAISPNTIAQWSDDGPGVIRQVVAFDDYAKAVIPEAVDQNAQRLIAATGGDPAAIFGLNIDTSRSVLPGIKDLTMPEIYENVWALDPTGPILNDAHKAFFREVDRQFSEILGDLRVGGVSMDFLDEVTHLGHYPRIFRMVNEIELRQKLQVFGGKPFYENARTYDFIEDALSISPAVGFDTPFITDVYKVGADPLQDIGFLQAAMYKRLVDHQSVRSIEKYGLTINERIGDGLLDAVEAAKATLDGTRIAADFVRTFDVVTLAPKVGRRFQGRTEAARAAPNIMKRLEEISTIRIKAARSQAFLELRADAAEELRRARTNWLQARKAKAQARVLAKAKPGEVQFPFTGLQGKIFTSTERLAIQSPESVINDFSTLPQDSLKQLQKIVKGPQKEWLDIMVSISGASRTIVAGLDYGVMMIHLAPLFTSDPPKWAATMKVALDSFANPTTYARFRTDHAETINKLIAGNQWHGAGAEHVEALRRGGLLFEAGGAVPEALGRIGGTTRGIAAGKAVGKGTQTVLNSFELFFNSALSTAKVFTYEALEPMVLRSGDPNAINNLMSFISKSTGTISMANLGTPPSVRKALAGLLMFAPRYRMAVYGLMADAFRGGIKGSMARDQFGKMAIGGLLMYSALGMRLKQEPNLDPRSGKFLTYQIGGANIGIGSAFTSLTRFFLSGGVQMFTDPEAFFRIDQRDSKLHRFARAQLAPFTSVLTSLSTGTNFMGKPTTGSWPNFFNNLVRPSIMPFYLDALFDGAGFQGAAGEVGGLRAFPTSNYQRAQDKADTIMFNETRKRWKDVSPLVRTEFLNEHPDIRAEFDKSNKVFAGLGIDLAQYRGEIDDYNDNVHRPALEQLALRIRQQLGNQDLNEQFNVGKSIRDDYKEIKTGFTIEYDRLERKYPDVVQTLKDQAPNPDVDIADLAYYRYIREVLSTDFEMVDVATGELTGQFDFDAWNSANQSFIASVTPAIWDYIQGRRVAGKNLPIELQELVDGQEVLRPYWDVWVSIIEELARADPGINLSETKRLYRNYRRVDPETKRQMGDLNPLLKQIERIESQAKALHRETNQDKDAFLFRWGYGGLLKHPENMARDFAELRRTPVYLGVENVR